MDVEFAVKSIYTRTSGNSRSSVRFGVTSKGQYPCALEWQGNKLFLLMSQGIRKRMESKSKVPGYEGTMEVRSGVRGRSRARQGEKNGRNISRNRGHVFYEWSAECLEGDKTK